MTDTQSKPQSIQEWLDSCTIKAGHSVIIANCAKHGISLDSPWPPVYPSEYGREPEPVPAKPAPAKILQFPLPFGEDTRAVSNALARCALFAPVRERQFFKDYMTVYDAGGLRIEIKGEQLNQDDADVFLQLMMMANHKPLGEDVCQRVNVILRNLNRSTQQSQRVQLFNDVDRLVSTTFEITQKGFPTLTGHLLDDATTPKKQTDVLPQYERHLAYRINPKIARFFGPDAYTLFNWQERVKLKGRGSELAKWLHLWIISHVEQYPHKVETIREKCGSKARDLKEFRRKLRQALDLLKEARIIAAWHIDAADLVHIERTPNPVQLGHLVRKAAKDGKRRKKMTAVSDLFPSQYKPKK